MSFALRIAAVLIVCSVFGSAQQAEFAEHLVGRTLVMRAACRGEKLTVKDGSFRKCVPGPESIYSVVSVTSIVWNSEARDFDVAFGPALMLEIQGRRDYGGRDWLAALDRVFLKTDEARARQLAWRAKLLAGPPGVYRFRDVSIEPQLLSERKEQWSERARINLGKALVGAVFTVSEDGAPHEIFLTRFGGYGYDQQLVDTIASRINPP